MSIYDFEVKPIGAPAHKLDKYKGKVLLIVNVASRCGYTPQYTGLEALYKKYKDDGLVILGFPCNQFGKQEPGGEEDIAQFCSMNYGVSFPVHHKTDVNGDAAHPLYKHLKAQSPGVLGTEFIENVETSVLCLYGNRRRQWNFTKFLVDRDGRVVRRYGPNETPHQIDKDVRALLSGEPLPAGGFRHRLEGLCKKVFYAEGFLNSLSAFFLMFFPDESLNLMGFVNHDPAHALLIQQFASIVLILGYIGLRARPTKELEEALAIGDVAYVVVFVPFVQKYGSWTPSSIFSVGSVVFLCLARLTFIFLAYSHGPAAGSTHVAAAAAAPSRGRGRSPRKNE